MTDDLYSFAEDKGIKVFPFSLPDCESISIISDGTYYIGIDCKQFDTSANERVHLAHEIGHCETGAFYNEFSPVDNRGKCEEQANRWAIKKLINKDELLQQLKNGMQLWDLADYFNVTEDFIRKAYHLYFELKPL